MLPNGPAESRLEMIRAASAGPMPGSDSMVAESARSRSIGPASVACCDTGGVADRGPRFVRGFSRVESILESCRSSAASDSASEDGLAVRDIRTALPDNATRARNQSAFRSLEVATPPNYIDIAATRTPFRRGRYQ